MGALPPPLIDCHFEPAPPPPWLLPHVLMPSASYHTPPTLSLPSTPHTVSLTVSTLSLAAYLHASSSLTPSS